MNQPDRYSRFVLPSGVDQAIEFKQDTKMRAAAQFNIWLEDHTIGNLVRHQLLSDPEVRGEVTTCTATPDPGRHGMLAGEWMHGCSLCHLVVTGCMATPRLVRRPQHEALQLHFA